MRVVAGFVVVFILGTLVPAYADDHGESCSSRWHQSYIQGLTAALDPNDWKCHREEVNDLGHGRYAKRTGVNTSGPIGAWYYDAELYGGYFWKRGVWDKEFTASFWGRVWDVNHRDIDNNAFRCFEAQSIRRASYRVVTYCSTEPPFAGSGENQAYDQTSVENIMRNGGLYKPE